MSATWSKATTPRGGLESWYAHPRLLRHARRFETSRDPEAVLLRYYRLSAEDPELLRAACHVAAWVALLPEELVARPQGRSELSAVRLLAQLLRRRLGKRITPWLRGILQLVARRQLPGIDGGDQEHWLQLKRSLPNSFWKSLSSDPVLEADPETSEATERSQQVRDQACGVEDQVSSLRAVRKQQLMAIARADALDGDSRESEVISVQVRAQAALDHNNPDRMIEAVVEAVGLLSPPREIISKSSVGASMTERAQAQLRAASQSRLRAFLLYLLGLLSGNSFPNTSGLDLEDPGTMQLLQVPFERLRQLLKDRVLEGLACAPQWALLAGVVGISVAGLALSDYQGAGSEHSRTRRSVKWASVVLAAAAAHENILTRDQLLDFAREADPELISQHSDWKSKLGVAMKDIMHLKPGRNASGHHEFHLDPAISGGRPPNMKKSKDGWRSKYTFTVDGRQYEITGSAQSTVHGADELFSNGKLEMLKSLVLQEHGFQQIMSQGFFIRPCNRKAKRCRASTD
ncbi:unnamed protein product [Polarella glacialis]|uniref:Uncharacterized protein n=1 Tax=Polarella glacialis TaxID=89957 RepID=A0A813L836_POLGL|nr:unnamed protein product [Polarella glacialis]